MADQKISGECLQDFLNEDFTQSEIGKMCSMSRQGVQQKIERMSISYRDLLLKRKRKDAILIKELAEKGYGIIEISEKLSISYGTIKRRTAEFKINILNKRINYKRLAEILFLRTKGFSKKEIAEELKINFQNLSSKRHFKGMENYHFVHGRKGY